jgi:hypothetical protein
MTDCPWGFLPRTARDRRIFFSSMLRPSHCNLVHVGPRQNNEKLAISIAGMPILRQIQRPRVTPTNLAIRTLETMP